MHINTFSTASYAYSLHQDLGGVIKHDYVWQQCTVKWWC